MLCQNTIDGPACRRVIAAHVAGDLKSRASTMSNGICPYRLVARVLFFLELVVRALRPGSVFAILSPFCLFGGVVLVCFAVLPCVYLVGIRMCWLSS